MKYIPPEQFREVTGIDLLSYMKIYEPERLVKESWDTYHIKEHHSVKLNNGLWIRFSKHIGGRTALRYFIDVENKTKNEAIEYIYNRMFGNLELYNEYKKIEQQKPKEKAQKKVLILPQKSPTTNIIKSYLKSRCIDEEIINYCIENNLLYEDLPRHNVVFVGYDEQNIAKFACVRGTSQTRFMHDVSGSSKDYSFRLLGKNPTTSLHIFESAIDLLSFATMLKRHGLNFKEYSMISLSGVYQTASKLEESKVPVVIKKFLENNKSIIKIELHLDNDIAGRESTRAFQLLLGKDYQVVDKPAKYGKDYNDYLCYETRKSRQKTEEMER